jgi:hypothetical protein
VKIYVIGDSISVQYGPFLEKYLAGIVEYSRKEGEEEAHLDLDRPQVANGGDSSMVLSFLRAKAAHGGVKADLLLVNCGLHDFRTTIADGAKQVPLERYRENLNAIVDVAERMGVPMAWIRTTPCDDKTHNERPGAGFYRFSADCAAYNAAADAVMSARGIPLIDLYAFTLFLEPDLYYDHIHFKEPVREKQAAFIAGWIAGYSAGRVGAFSRGKPAPDALQ